MHRVVGLQVMELGQAKTSSFLGLTECVQEILAAWMRYRFLLACPLVSPPCYWGILEGGEVESHFVPVYES